MPAYGDVGVEHHTALETTLLEQSACALIQTHESRVFCAEKGFEDGELVSED